MDLKNVNLYVFLATVFLGIAAATSGSNSTCTTPCGTQCCSETEECTSTSFYGKRCRQTGKKIDCPDGLSYCIEPATCCGVMSCCPSNTQCCGLSSCCAKGAVCCGMSTCCPEGSSCCGFSVCCSRGSQCVNGLCRVPWSSSMRWYYLVAALVPLLFVMLYLAKRRQLRIAQRRGQMQGFVARGHGSRNTSSLENHMSPCNTGYDPAPTMFEPPPYSEIAQSANFMPNPEEKPPAYSELYNDVPVPEGENNEGATGNQTGTVDGDATQENRNGNQGEIDNAHTTQNK